MVWSLLRTLGDLLAAPVLWLPSAGGLLLLAAATGLLVDFLIQAGVSGLFPGGTTGEGILLTTHERRQLAELVVKAAAGRVPVIIHSGAITSAETLALTAHAQAIGAVAAGRAQELWLIAGEATPVSLGVLSTDAETEVIVPQALRPLFAGAVLAVSDEPPTGSPTGAPTGDVLAFGTVSEI